MRSERERQTNSLSVSLRTTKESSRDLRPRATTPAKQETNTLARLTLKFMDCMYCSVDKALEERYTELVDEESSGGQSELKIQKRRTSSWET